MTNSARRALALLGAALLSGAVAAADDVGGELRVRWDAAGANASGPIGEANRLAPGLAPTRPSTGVAEAELHGHWRALTANQLFSLERPEGGAAASSARFNEL